MTNKVLSPVVNVQLFDNNGNMLSGGTITVYKAGTLSLANIYANADGGALTNPIVLNASGRIPNGQLFLDLGQYYDISVKKGTTVLESYSNIAGLLDANTGVLGSVTVDQFTGDGFSVNFTLSTAPDDISITTVIVNGLVLTGAIDYAIISNRITFNVAPAVGDQIVVKYNRTVGSDFPRDVNYTQWASIDAQLTYVMNGPLDSINNLLVTMDGLVLKPQIDYTWSSSFPYNLVLLSNPGTGKDIDARIF
jgi:hypothetical protein